MSQMGPAPAVQMGLGLDIPADGFEKQTRVEVLLIKQHRSSIVIDLPTSVVSALWQVAGAGQGQLRVFGVLVTGWEGLLTLPHWDVRAGARPCGTLHECENTRSTPCG